MEIRDTDTVIIDSELRRKLADYVTVDEVTGCHIVSIAEMRSLQVRPKFWRYARSKAWMAVTRVAWALANPRDHMTANEFAVHTCNNTGMNGRTLCANGAHLRKGCREDIQHAKALRAKGFFQKAA